MPASPSALAALVKSNVSSRMAEIRGYAPLQQRNPSYYIEFAEAIGTGIINGGPDITFTTVDVGFSGIPPVPGVGAGIGIITDPTFFVQDLYTRIRQYVLDDFGRTLHDPYPPRPGNSGQYLLALCKGINDSFLSYYPTAWTLVSAHPIVYMGVGTINDGQFAGLSAPTIQSDIIAGAPNFVGRFWPRLAQAVSESYVELIEQHSTGTVTITGICTPAPPAQTCNITGVPGVGTGNAT
jgi:hypothetical protein